MSYSLLETDTRKIRYQTARQTRQKTGTGFWRQFLFLVSVSWALMPCRELRGVYSDATQLN